jgi:UDP-glucuronate decarboxylase
MTVKPIFEKKNVLVVGGAGFIGSHLCDALVAEHKVICLDNFLTGSERNIDHLLQNPNFEFVRHDATEPWPLTAKEEGLEKFKVAWQGVQEIYYLASPTATGDVQRYPIETLLANSLGLRHALELAAKNKAKLLYVSSDLVYGESSVGEQRVSEGAVGVADQLGERSPYVEGKRFGEALVTAYRRHFELDVRIARVFPTYGPRMKLTDTRLVVEFTRRSLRGEPLVVYGGPEALGSYCYVADTVKGLVKLMEQGEARPVNLGQEQAVKLVDLAREIIALTGSSSAVAVEAELPAPYHRQLLPDISRAKETLGWFPVTLLNDGLRHTVEFLKASQGLLDLGAGDGR